MSQATSGRYHTISFPIDDDDTTGDEKRGYGGGGNLKLALCVAMCSVALVTLLSLLLSWVYFYRFRP